MTPKSHYQNYMADDTISPLSIELCNQVIKFRPVHVLDFGSGSGKHVARIERMFNVSGCALDLSFNNASQAHFMHQLPFIVKADETYLRHFCNFDVIITCSVLDHIEDIKGIIGEFKRIANKAIVIAETNTKAGEFYYPHNYEQYGFTKIDFSWKSESDNATYHIWVWHKSVSIGEAGNSFVNDDLAK